jgi:hypothetical protein
VLGSRQRPAHLPLRIAADTGLSGGLELDVRRRQALEPFQQGQRLFRARAALYSRGQEPSRILRISPGERRGASLEQLFAFTVALGNRAARARAVGAGPRGSRPARSNSSIRDSRPGRKAADVS